MKEIEDLLTKAHSNTKAKLIDCSNRFYTNIPHNFGLRKPDIIESKKILQFKMDMLEVTDNLLP